MARALDNLGTQWVKARIHNKKVMFSSHDLETWFFQNDPMTTHCVPQLSESPYHVAFKTGLIFMVAITKKHFPAAKNIFHKNGPIWWLSTCKTSVARFGIMVWDGFNNKQAWTSAHRCARGFLKFWIFFCNFFNIWRFWWFWRFLRFSRYKSLSPQIPSYLSSKIPKSSNPISP